tara:strand:- start:874 stop:1638 length:765 start_codon:yes stop_codon:yes gene_type:complete
MATVNLGRIKPVFKNAWANGTTYAVDDFVVHGNECYICIQAGAGQNPTSASAYWTKIAAKGTDGTDVGTTLTTQGDILYRNSSGLAKLGAGTSGQFLKTQGTGANPIWATADSGKTLGVTQYTNNTRTSHGNVDTYNYWDTNYTQIKAGSKLIIDVNLIGHSNNNGAVNFDFEYDGTTYSGFGHYSYTAQSNPHMLSYRRMIDGASSTGAKNFKYQYDHASSTGSPWNVWNPNASDDNRLQQTVSTLIITEMDF